MVLDFKKLIEEGNCYLFRQYQTVGQFAEILEKHLARWQRDHEGTASALSAGPADGTTLSAPGSPGFDYWIVEARKQLEPGISDHAAALFCAQKATDTAGCDLEWAAAKEIGGIALARLSKPDEAILAFTAIAERFTASMEVDRLCWQAKALINKGITLGLIDRGEAAISVFDDVLARFATAPELPLREQVAKALVTKGITLALIDRGEAAIAVFDDVLARFATTPELTLREQAAKALEARAQALRLV
jgi:tetratricopeptide (TPR) repeat protein